ncbi:LADA_0B01068g1_1 [Lachancea dasiensis]|uniref:LADA_0B01068g1_1 n=1 Tax=Lachancea dasiensis TaxID=1072105 RepID=A0A1G4ISB5_9SACH|nr:LADA_0B01068g1_1 [Lachancea dasiensis]
MIFKVRSSKTFRKDTNLRILEFPCGGLISAYLKHISITSMYSQVRGHSPSATSVSQGNAKVLCQCGTISFRASRPKPLAVFICHCTECQKQSASAFGSSYIFPSEGLWPLPDDIRQQLGIWKRKTDSGNTLECYFCKTCGVRILHRSILPDGKPKPTVTIKAGCVEGFTLDGARHIYTRSAVVPVPADSDSGPPQQRP